VQNSKRIVTQKAMARAATAAPTVAMERAPATTAAVVVAAAAAVIFAAAQRETGVPVMSLAAQLRGVS